MVLARPSQRMISAMVRRALWNVGILNQVENSTRYATGLIGSPKASDGFACWTVGRRQMCGTEHAAIFVRNNSVYILRVLSHHRVRPWLRERTKLLWDFRDFVHSVALYWFDISIAFFFNLCSPAGMPCIIKSEQMQGMHL